MVTRVLKHDTLGTVRLIDEAGTLSIERDTHTAAPCVRWLARRLAAREAAALVALRGLAGVPQLLTFDGRVLRRSHVPGLPLHVAPPRPPRFFGDALRLLRTVHRAGVAHNDLAKEANWLCGPGGSPGIVDFQLAALSRSRGKWFRALAYEDLRHLLKHKRTYEPERLTTRQKAVLARPTLATRLWRAWWKPLYLAVTRRLLRWPERAGPLERQG